MNDQDKKAMFRRIILSILTFSPALLALWILSMSKGPLSQTTLAMISFLVGCSGVIIAIRKEIPMSLKNVKGKSAVFQGVSLTIICWLLAIYFAIFGLE